MKEGGNFGAMAAAVLATVFFVIQIIVGGGLNYGLYAVVFSVFTAGYIVKSIRLKRRQDIIIAVINTVAVLLFSVAHIYNLITVSAIL